MCSNAKVCVRGELQGMGNVAVRWMESFCAPKRCDRVQQMVGGPGGGVRRKDIPPKCFKFFYGPLCLGPTSWAGDWMGVVPNPLPVI